MSTPRKRAGLRRSFMEGFTKTAGPPEPGPELHFGPLRAIDGWITRLNRRQYEAKLRLEARRQTEAEQPDSQ